MTKEIIIIALLVLVLYLYYQPKNLNTQNSPNYQELQTKYQEVIKVNQTFAAFCQDEIGGQDINEIRTKLNGKKLTEILTENEDYELEVDTLTRTKKELEADLLSQSNSFKSLLKEKDGTIKRLEEQKKQLNSDLADYKKAGQEWRIKKKELQERIKDLEQEKKDLQSFSKKELDQLNKEIKELKK